MGSRDQTDIGGAAEAFLTTHWSLIDGIRNHRDKDQAMIGALLERYWKPVYCYLRRRGYQNEEAKDLTQDFFHEIVLNRNLTQRADSAKGRFRALVLRALDQFLIDQKRRAAAGKRAPKGTLVSLDAVGLPELPGAIEDGSPEQCFAYAWKSALIDCTLSEVQAECEAQGLQTHWKIFSHRIVGPALKGLEPPPMRELCTRYEISSESAASNMLVTVKRRFRTTLRRNVRATVLSDNDVDGELREILALLGEKERKNPT